MARPYDLVVVGLGSGGLVAARFAVALGLRVAAVDQERPGGDCLWTGCVPSKALLASARAAQTMRTADGLGLPAVEPAVDTARVLSRIRAVQERIASSDDDPDRLRRLGIDLRLGAPARITGPHEIEVGPERLTTRRILLCTGSDPDVPDLPGLGETGHLTSDTIWDLERAPASLLVLGGGPVAVELAQAFTRLGSPATVLEAGPRLLPGEAPVPAGALTARLEAEGVGVATGVAVERAAREDGRVVVHGRRGGRPGHWSAEALLVATGRRPRVAGLGLEALGVAVGPEGIRVDERSRTSVPSIYAAGDVAGRHRFTHTAAQEAALAVRDMFLPGPGRVQGPVPWCTFTDPELARAGLTEAEARARHGDRRVRAWRIGLDHSDRARTDAAEEGLLELVTVRGRLVGAHVLAPAAGELIGELALAIRKKMRLTELATLIHVYPAMATSIAQLAAQASWETAGRLRWLARAQRTRLATSR